MKKNKRKRIIPHGWKEIKISDVFETSSGSTPTASKQEYYENGDIPWINSGELTKPYIYRTNNFITKEGYDNSSTKMYPIDTVLVAMYGATAGKASILKMEACTNQAVCAILPNPDYDPLFIKYSIDTLYDYLVGLSTGSARDNLSQAGIKDLKLIVPNSLKEQKQLASVLATLDKKITLNRQINDNLEAMAKQLYDYWFVQFDFPDEKGKPYKSSGGKMVWYGTLKQEIPNGWYVSNICKVAEILSGGTPSKAITKYWDKGTIPFFGPTDCNGNIYQLQTKDHITEEGLKHCASSLYEDGTIFITARGSIGKLVIAGTSMAMNQSCYALRSKTGEYEYLFFLTQQLIEWLKAKGNGSVFKSIISSDIEASSLCIGGENIIALYCKRVKPIFKKIKANSQEILSLIKQRDELLPLLMNGQATVNYHLADDYELFLHLFFEE